MTQPPIRDGKLDHEGASEALRRFLDPVLRSARMEVSYTIAAHPEAAGQPGEGEAERPEITVDFAGRDRDLLLERNAEVLKALEYLALKALRLEPQYHEKIRFDSGDYRALRIEELKLSAKVAAERVRTTRQPFSLNPMSPRERRLVHLALKDVPGVRTASEGTGDERKVVIFPADGK